MDFLPWGASSSPSGSVTKEKPCPPTCQQGKPSQGWAGASGGGFLVSANASLINRSGVDGELGACWKESRHAPSSSKCTRPSCLCFQKLPMRAHISHHVSDNIKHELCFSPRFFLCLPGSYVLSPLCRVEARSLSSTQFPPQQSLSTTSGTVLLQEGFISFENRTLAESVTRQGSLARGRALVW